MLGARSSQCRSTALSAPPVCLPRGQGFEFVSAPQPKVLHEREATGRCWESFSCKEIRSGRDAGAQSVVNVAVRIELSLPQSAL